MTGTEQYDVVVVGAGSAGAALAGRLAQASARSVLLLERGGRRPTTLDPDRLPADGDPTVMSTALRTGDGSRVSPLLAGAVLGGSGAVNGAYFVRPTDEDLGRWAAGGNDAWSLGSVLAAMRRLETDVELGDTERHGGEGPMRVTRAAHPPHAVTEALFAAAASLGHAEQRDLNGGGGDGWGTVPRNLDDLGRLSSARAYLGAAEVGRPTLRTGCHVSRVLFARGRAVGVELIDADGRSVTVQAATVVLSAGALGSSELLRRSGIGPAAELRADGIDVVVDAPGLGTRARNHAALDLCFSPRPGLLDAAAPLLQGALHLRTPSGAPVEVLGMCTPYGRATGADPADGRLSLRVSTMCGRTPVVVRHEGGRPWIDAAYLHDARDRADWRAAVREAVELVRSEAFGSLVEHWHGPSLEVVAVDRDLDAWIAAHLGTSHHLCATAPMGPGDDPEAVVDQLGRVRGVDGLAVVDLSILPDAPSRGPSCTAVVLAEHLAATFEGPGGASGTVSPAP